METLTDFPKIECPFLDPDTIATEKLNGVNIKVKTEMGINSTAFAALWSEGRKC